MFEDDATFDAIYPPSIRLLSRRHWTPVAVARRAAKLFLEVGARNVLDVGSGPGKFVLVAAVAAPEISFVGVERRHYLLTSARRAGDALAIPNAHFVYGDVTRSSWSRFDGLYFFNPFEECLLTDRDRVNNTADVSRARFIENIRRTERGLRVASVGTAVVTFDGCGGRIPGNYELMHQEFAESAWLRLWVKRSSSEEERYFVELYDAVRVTEGGSDSYVRGPFD